MSRSFTNDNMAQPPTSPVSGGSSSKGGNSNSKTKQQQLVSHIPARRGLGEPVFRVKHYAGDVDYAYQGFVEKNEDSLYHDLVDCLAASEVDQIAVMFGGGDVDGNGGEDEVASPKSPKSGVGGQKKKPPSVSLQFKRQVNELMATLGRSKPHYVRCVKVRGFLNNNSLLSLATCSTSTCKEREIEVVCVSIHL
jgi:hypothetical protein